MSTYPRFEVWGVPGIPEVHPHDDLVGLLIDALHAGDAAGPLSDGDIVVVTSKIVSKSEGRLLRGVDRDEAIDAEAVRTVSEWTTPRGRTRIVETRHGFVMAAAGVDASNVTAGDVVLLPEDPDASARRIRDGIRDRLGARVGVVVTDTAGRVWRNGVVDVAIGAAGIHAVDDLRGRSDPYGNDLGVTIVAVADELAAATELVRGKLSGVPIAVVRGLAHLVRVDDGTPDPGASVLIRPSAEDRFRLGTPEAMREAVLMRHDVTAFTPETVDHATIRRAVAAALTAPYPARPGTESDPPVRFVAAESARARSVLADAVRAPGRDPAEVLLAAGAVLVPCAVAGNGGSTAAGNGADAGDHSVTLAVGAAVENLLVTLAADGLGASWLFPAAGTSPAKLAADLDLPAEWAPHGAIVIGHPAAPPQVHPPRPLDGFLSTR
ncbi:coenzyme F420-0:L-glutamate ligase [Phytoactinopolyspora halotolerans]|uniref:Coenzyme F420-0:L-glutamate ligase n=1 Tax=Phytoactinopolyspora halotolerans TaxID=1981512 RepID=A0A6L9SI40_9ACTN|nr:coenzyme F420-0:L-glutamate ligase [Phytoactinopolyspora halotolerans]NEE04102.1 coenzyme F420-0:L-glutamate ligase [Phytoactinopolyspora halotolerans]